jgi:hypothetical protein
MRANASTKATGNYAIAWFLIALGILAVAGCSKSDNQATTISGMVEFEGEPVRVGEIRFVPIRGTQASTVGGKIRDGQYSLSPKQSLKAGEYRVEVMGYRNPKDPQAEVNLQDADSNYIQYIPSKHNQNSQAAITIESTHEPVTRDFILTK